MMPRKVVQMEPPSDRGRCCFCGLTDDNELEYGKIHEYNGIVTHYYCLLLSSNMQQKGRDEEGILGFLPDDIYKELKRGKRLNCCYCKKNGATLGCCNMKCKKIFHFPCGLKSGSLHQFFGEFRSYCKNHRPRQNIDDRVLEEVKKRDDMICYICYDNVNPRDMYGTLWAPCCKKNAWFHRICVQQLAMSAGYFFKCPLCNNKVEFQRAMLDYGIFIPSQDASWELVPNAFEELLYRHNRCDADDCLCPKGREHTSSNAKWELTLCRTCGSQGIHMACGQLKWVKPVWECSECISILNKTMPTDSESSVITRESGQLLRLRKNDLAIIEDSSDSEISVGTESMEASTSESASFVKIREDETEKTAEEPVALRVTRRSVIPIPKSPVNTKIQIPKAVTSKEDLPPEPKRPRLADHISHRSRRESIESDDDIIVISGPSRSENPAPNGRTTPTQRHSVNNFRPVEKKLEIEQPNLKEKSQEPKAAKTPPTILHEATNKPPLFPVFQAPTKKTNKVVEIDLSESESTVSDTRSNPTVNTNSNIQLTNSIVSGTPAVSTVVNPPELNIVITNVTSLAPEAFENVQEQKPEVKNESTNVSSRTTTFNHLSGGLTPQNPIVLDDEPLPLALRNHIAQNNNLHFSSTEIHDQMKLIRFDPPTDPTGNPTNVLYGITIPGTNQTVPLILTVTDDGSSKQTTAINSDVGKPTAITSDSNAWNNKQQIRAESNKPLRNLGVPIAPRPIANQTSSLSPSVPLMSVVNEKFPTSRTTSRKDKNSNRPVSILPKDSPAAPQNLASASNGSFIRIPASSSLPNKSVTNPGVPISNGYNPPKASEKHIVSSQPNNSLPNGFDLKTISKMFALLPPQSSPASQENSHRQNGVVSSTTSRSERSVLKQNTEVATNTAGNVSNVNTTWLNCQRPLVEANAVTANTSVAKTNISPSTQLQIQKSVENKQQITEPQLFQLIRTDQNKTSTDDCDGDAGSGPAVQPASVNNPTNTKPSHTRRATTSPRLPGGVLESRKSRCSDHGISGRGCGTDTNDAADCSASPDRSDAPDRTGLIYKSINLRDLNFSTCGSDIVKMTLYNTYTVNIKVDSSNPCKKFKYSSSRRTTKCSLGPEAGTRSTESCDPKDVTNSLDSQPRSEDDAMDTLPSSDVDATLNQSENTTESSVLHPESIYQSNDLPPIDVGSRGHDELKENLDPVPPSTNSTHNATNAVDRKSKLRLHSGVNHSTRLLNEKESQQMICEKNETQKKVVSQESQSVQNQSKVMYNGWKDTACYEELNAQNVLHDRSVEMMANNLMLRSSVNGKSTDDLNQIQAYKKKRNSVSANHLVNDAESSKRKWSSTEDISRSKKCHVNSLIDSDTKNTSGKLISCKVSIDLARIRAVLAAKLDTIRNILNCKFERCTVAKRTAADSSVFDSKSIATLSKSCSFDNLTFDPGEDSINVLRKSKSFEDLNSLSSQSSVNDFAESRLRGCKRRRRSFEKHDCVR